MVPVLPVVQVGDRLWLKRDDLHVPFSDTQMNGAKTYQCMNLIGSHLQTIRDKYAGTIYSDNFLQSPQGPIVSRVAKEYGLRCIIPVASDTQETALQHRSMQLVRGWGGEVDVVCQMGFALSSRAQQKYGDQYFRVRFGMSTDSPSVLRSVVDPVRQQVQAFDGLPTETMTLVVPVGSGVVFGSLLVGLAQRKIRFKRIVGVQISGYDRLDKIHRVVRSYGYELPEQHTQSSAMDFFQEVERVPAFDFVPDTTYPYARHISSTVGGVELDSQYEAKAWDWAVRTGISSDPLMFYVVGNSNCLR